MFDRIVELAPDLVAAARRSSPGDLDDVLELLAFAQYSTGDAESAFANVSEVLGMVERDVGTTLQALSTFALAAAALGRIAEARSAIDRFQRLANEDFADFGAYFGTRSESIRQRITTAESLLAAARQATAEPDPAG